MNRNRRHDFGSRLEFERRTSLCQGDGTSRHQAETHLTAGIKHFLRPIPAVGKMLIVEDGGGATCLFEGGHNLIEEFLPWILLLTLSIHGVLAMLADRQNPVDSQIVPLERQCLGNRGKNGNAILFGKRTRHFVVGELIHIEADDLTARVGPHAVEEVVFDEVFEENVGVASIGETGDHRAHSKGFFLRPHGRSHANGKCRRTGRLHKLSPIDEHHPDLSHS